MEMLLAFSKHVGVKETYETGVLATLEVLSMFMYHFQDKLVEESHSFNAIPHLPLWALGDFILSYIVFLDCSGV